MPSTDYWSNTVAEQLTFNINSLKHETCIYCNGYYGPSHGEPVCSTCHEFIHPEEIHSVGQQPIPRPLNTLHLEDDGDSGNDEPSEEAGGASAPPPPPAEPPGPEVERQQQWDEKQNEKLANRVALLSTAWDPQEAAAALADKSNTEDFSLRIPPEIWTLILSKLDNVSLLMASQVSSRWKDLVDETDLLGNRWENLISYRWPLFQPTYPVKDWQRLCTNFLKSLSCQRCFINIDQNVIPIFSPPHLLRSDRLKKEIKLLRHDHPEGVQAVPLDQLNYNWLARITGPPDSPYAGGVFYLNLKVPYEYPLRPPIVRFLTRVFHPNISRHGDIGIDCIGHNWTLALTIPQILLSVQSLLTDPHLDTCMEPAVARLYVDDRKEFEHIARCWTWTYAMHDILTH